MIGVMLGKEDQPMTALATPLPSLIYLDGTGQARLQDTRFKVDQIARWYRSGMPAEQINAEHPELSLEQIYASLSYYHGHRQEIDALIAREDEDYAQLRTQTVSPFAERMRSEGDLP
jgi:uncharacterized protein (DUF433 family)